jgi:antibiotic biosynthesis monooxygenase (ABM) superfamily enzyme
MAGFRPPILEDMSSPQAGFASTPQPVTVSITRSVDPARLPEVTRWVQAGVNLANTWPGFLGSGWVRSAADSTDWHMLYRFADAVTLDAWQTSPERRRWLEGGRGLVEERRVHRVTGIEGWFDAPVSTTHLDADAPGADADAAGVGARGGGAAGLGAGAPSAGGARGTGAIGSDAVARADAGGARRAMPVAPPRWKQAVSIWLGFFPVNLAFTLLVTLFVPGWNDLPTALKVFLTTTALTPLMTYWILPFVTARLKTWLVAPPRAR